MTDSLLVRSFCKINLALEVLGRRPDGYHELRTVFQSLDLHDEIVFAESESLSLDCDGLPGLAPESNLVWRAAAALREAFGVAAGARISLRKRVPAGGGLGGGSSNAAATLLGLCRLWKLDVPAGRLRAIGARLGSDVPFFLTGGTVLGVGRGEETYPLADFPSTALVVVYPGVHVSTAEAYRRLNASLTSWAEPLKIQSFCTRLDEGQPAWLFNDFESSVLPAYPVIREAMDFLRSRGATEVLLSGSGSSVFGLFQEEESALRAARGVSRDGWRVLPAKTLSRAEYSLRMFG